MEVLGILMFVWLLYPIKRTNGKRKSNGDMINELLEKYYNEQDWK